MTTYADDILDLDTPDFLDTHELAELLDVPERTLED